jgi:hypothetical protein
MIRFSAEVKSTSIKVTKSGERRIHVTLAAVLDRDLARGLGALGTFELLTEHEQLGGTVELDALRLNAAFKHAAQESDPFSRGGRIELRHVRGVKAVCKAGDDETPMTAAVELWWSWDPLSWQFLGRAWGSVVDVEAAKTQEDLPGLARDLVDQVGLGGAKAAVRAIRAGVKDVSQLVAIADEDGRIEALNAAVRDGADADTLRAVAAGAEPPKTKGRKGPRRAGPINDAPGGGEAA